ncbi:MAG: glycoside hydrolase family 3 protein [Oscillospiraceae bacterium]|nr:glycoside hydrolase family 3 protein [Oscillospiraceae bacterium]
MSLFKNKSTRIWLIVTVLVLVVAIVANVVCLTVPIVSNSLSLVFGGESSNVSEDLRDTWYDRQYSTKAEVLAAAKDFVVKVEQEGITLLKNEGNALPLGQNPKVSVFGKNSVNLVYGGSGSAGNTASVNKTLYESLEAAGIGYNPTLKSFYEDNSKSGEGRPNNPSMDSGQRLSGFATGETPVSSYTADVKASYAGHKDAAIVVISRIGGEGFDLPRTMESAFGSGTPVTGAETLDSHYLELDANEKAMIEEAKANFDKVIVVLNVGTTMELGSLQNDPEIDAILWMGLPGSTGVMALGDVLVGNVNPSGHTVDTWAVDFTKDPTWYNTGIYGSQYGNRYLNSDGSQSEFAFVNYEEGIYVGYRYYETRGYEDGEAWYAENVVYPFGYGLSYTSFDWDVQLSGGAVSENDTITATVTVTNTGAVAGKDVVQLYYSAPYTPGGIEKAHVVLGDFAKTKLLNPGESDTLTLELKASDMASYDYADANGNGFKGYELESGDYTIYVSSDAHTHEASAVYTVASGVKLWGDRIQNRFDDVSAGIYGDLTYGSFVSRTDFEGTLPKAYLTDARRTLTAELEEALGNSIKRVYRGTDEGQPWQVDASQMPATEPVNNGISLRDMLYTNGEFVGQADFDDPRWEDLLDQISLDEMKLLVGYGAFRTNAVEGVDGVVGKPLTTDSDGPSGFTSFLSESVVYDTCAYMAECVMGATWNVDLAYEFGQMVGEESLVGNEKGDGMPYSGWYSPAVNIHRSPFAGRNWEYYSEDGLLSGKFAAQVVQGAKTKGVYCYVKHFAVNDQETDREYNGILVWANEQSMRELYLKPFELSVTEGGATGMMSSFNRLGLTWAGGSYALLTEVLRNEWGFRGMVITDYSMNRYTYVDMMIRAGGDLFLTQDAKTFTMEDDATQVSLLRQATKNILYTVVNSNVMATVVDGYSTPVWQTVMFAIDAVLVIALAAWGVVVLRKSKGHL